MNNSNLIIDKNKDYINNNFNEIIKELNESNYTTFFDDFNTPILRKILIDNFLIIFKKSLSIKNHLYYILYKLNQLTFNEITIKYINNILDIIDIQTFLNIYSSFSNINENIDTIVNNFYLDNKLEIAKNLLITNVSYLNTPDKDLNKYTNFLSFLIDDLLEINNMSFIEHKYINSGSYSQVYKFKDFVLKIGNPREEYFIPNNKHILQPLVRTNLINSDNNYPFGCIEIAPLVELCDLDNIKEDDLYKVYKELRLNNIICIDFKIDNFGILKSDNNIGLTNYFRGFTSNDEIEILKEGNLVIIDTDFIYNIGTNELKLNSLLKSFEKRYYNETKQKKLRK